MRAGDAYFRLISTFTLPQIVLELNLHLTMPLAQPYYISRNESSLIFLLFQRFPYPKHL